MEDLNWLVDLASDCLAFGKKHGLQHVELGAIEVINAVENDFRSKFKILPRPTSSAISKTCALPRLTSNIVPFPLKFVNPPE